MIASDGHGTAWSGSEGTGMANKHQIKISASGTRRAAGRKWCRQTSASLKGAPTHHGYRWKVPKRAKRGDRGVKKVFSEALPNPVLNGAGGIGPDRQ